MNTHVSFASPLKLLLVHLTCGLGLALAFWVAFNLYSRTLIQIPAETLFIVWAVEASVVIPLYSLFRLNPDQCSYVKAIMRGLLGLPAGALLNAFGAIVLGAPVGIQCVMSLGLVSSLHLLAIFLFFLSGVTTMTSYQFPTHFTKTLNWSLLMSVFTFAPAASVCGTSWNDWHRIFAHVKPFGSTDFMITLPAYGSVIGAWFGAWPMPLDWERPWQDWPICVTYGAILGYSIGMIASVGFTVFHTTLQHKGKED